MIFHLALYDSYIDVHMYIDVLIAMTNGMMCTPMTIVRSNNI